MNNAIIFDLDGVIVDTAKYHYIAWQKIAEDLHIKFSKKDNENLKGVSRVKSLEFILKLGNIKLSDSKFKELLTAKNDHYLSLISNMDESEILPGIKDLLTDLQDNNIPFALGSASKNARRILDSLGLTTSFKVIVDGTDVSKAKPNPEVFLIAAKQLNYAPKNCIVIEDAKAGVQAANFAGMTSIGIGNKKILNEANFVLNNTTELNFSFLNNIIKK